MQETFWKSQNHARRSLVWVDPCSDSCSHLPHPLAAYCPLRSVRRERLSCATRQDTFTSEWMHHGLCATNGSRVVARFILRLAWKSCGATARSKAIVPKCQVLPRWSISFEIVLYEGLSIGEFQTRYFVI